MKKKIMIAVLPLLLVSSLTGCKTNSTSGNSNSQKTETITRKAIVVLKEDDREYLSIGETNQLKAYSSGDSSEKFIFKSLDEELASVDENGLVTAKKEGDVKIEVSLKSDSTVKKTVSFTIVKTLLQAIPELQTAFDDIKSYDYKKGVNLSFEMGISFGEIKASTSILGYEVNDITILDTYKTPLSVPVNFDIQNYKDDSGDTHTFLHSSLCVSDIINSFASSNETVKNIVDKVDFDEIYQSIANTISSDFNSYLKTEDFSNFYSFEFYSYGKSDTYVLLTRNFGTEENPDIRPFAYNKGNILNLLSPYADEILAALIKSYTSSSSNTNSDKINEFINKLVPGVSVDMDQLMTKDGIAFMQTVLAEMLETSTENDVTTIKLNKTAMERIQNVYSEYVTSDEYSFKNGDSSIGDVTIKYNIPSKLDSIKLIIDNTNSFEHKLKSLKFEIDGVRKVINGDSVSETPYPFITSTMNRPSELVEGEMDGMQATLENYKEAATGIFDISTHLATNSVQSLIEKANEIYNAEITYGADKSNANLQKVKTDLITYYYSDVYKSVERQNLLYPMMNRLESLDFTYQDEYVETYDSLSVEDNIKNKYSVNYFKSGNDVSLTKTYTSSNEDVISVDQNGNITGNHAYYNGKVVDNKKQADDSATITINTVNSENDEKKTFSKVFTYTGSNLTFKDTKTTFNSDNLDNATFDSTTRELTVDGDSFDVTKLLNLPSSGSITKYTSNNITVGYFGLFSNKSTIKVTGSNYGKLCGVNITVSYTENGTTKSEDVIFYVIFNNK